MCSPLLSPIGSLIKGGGRAGMALASPALAMIMGGRKRGTNPNQRFGQGYDPNSGGMS